MNIPKALGGKLTECSLERRKWLHLCELSVIRGTGEVLPGDYQIGLWWPGSRKNKTTLASYFCTRRVIIYFLYIIKIWLLFLLSKGRAINSYHKPHKGSLLMSGCYINLKMLILKTKNREYIFPIFNLKKIFHKGKKINF